MWSRIIRNPIMQLTFKLPKQDNNQTRTSSLSSVFLSKWSWAVVFLFGPPIVPGKSTCYFLYGFHQPPTAQTKHFDRRSIVRAHFSARRYKLRSSRWWVSRLLELLLLEWVEVGGAGSWGGRGVVPGRHLHGRLPGVAAAPHVASEDKRTARRTQELQSGAFFNLVFHLLL